MKRTLLISELAMATLMLSSCGLSKKSTNVDAVKSLEGETVRMEEKAVSGFEMADALNEDGTQIIKVPYRWFAGEAKADNKQVAIEMAQSEAYAIISREVVKAVLSESERANLVNNGVVQQALTQHWKQVSSTILKGCGPFGNVEVQYSEKTRMYTVRAKVGIRGDRYNKLIGEAGFYKPNNLKGQDLEDFIEINHKIMDAVKSE